MKIELVNKEKEIFNGTIVIPDDYKIPNGEKVVEKYSSRKEKDFFEEKKHIQLDGILINSYNRTSANPVKTFVKSDNPYIRMHFELSGGAIHYQHKNSKFSISAKQGEFCMFYLPNLDGTINDPVCTNADSFEIQLSKNWIEDYFTNEYSVVKNFNKDMASSIPTMLGGKSHTITPAIYKTINELRNCKFTGGIKKLYIEGKLLELLALQLDKTICTKPDSTKISLSKFDIEKLHFVKEIITNNISKNYTIQELAELSFMNRTKLQTAFKQLFGYTIHEYTMEIRMTKAYQILTNEYAKDWNIYKIADMVGYKHYNHFSTAFKKRFGISPSKFLKHTQ